MSQDNQSHEEHHEHSIMPYLMVFGALMVLTVLTVVVKWIHFESHTLEVTLALSIAFVKAGLVLYFFMHLNESPRIIAIVAVGSLLFVVLFFAFSLADLVTRDTWAPAPETWTELGW